MILLPLHGLGTRQDLPLPFELVVLGAATALLVSFAALSWAWTSPRWDGPPAGYRIGALTRLVDHRWFRLALRAIGIGVFGWVLMALWFGPDLVINPAFGFTYVWVWVGLVPLALIFGPVWRLLNPIRTLSDLLERVGLPTDGVLGAKVPALSRLGQYPAALAMAGFTWLELVQPDNNTLPVLRGWWLAWLVWLIAGVLGFGRQWIAAADPFEAYSMVVARASPWQRIDGQVALVNPLRHLTSMALPAGTWALVCVLLGGTAFDSFSVTGWWMRTVQTSSLPAWPWGTAGLVGMIVLVALTYALGVRGLGKLRQARLDLLAASVIPIVIGYAMAHYLSLLVLEGQRTLINLSDPLGLGWNVFGTAELGINQLWLDSPDTTALIQLGSIILGHIVGVLVAHELCLRVLTGSRRVSGQLPLLAVMIGYTCGGLVLLFSP